MFEAVPFFGSSLGWLDHEIFAHQKVIAIKSMPRCFFTRESCRRLYGHYRFRSRPKHRCPDTSHEDDMRQAAHCFAPVRMIPPKKGAETTAPRLHHDLRDVEAALLIHR